MQNCLVAERLLSQHLQGGRGLRKAMGGLKGPVCRGTLTPRLAGPRWAGPSRTPGLGAAAGTHQGPSTASALDSEPTSQRRLQSSPEGCAGRDLPGTG